jgi:hypothetical protein
MSGGNLLHAAIFYNSYTFLVLFRRLTEQTDKFTFLPSLELTN